MAEDTASRCPPLLGPDDPPPFEVIETDGDPPIIIVCDHASHAVPRSLGALGLSEVRLREHIGWDIGAAGVARHLAQRLGASLVLGGYSRLVVDLNRDLEDPTAFPAISDGVLIPGNLDLGVEARAERARALFKPYHEAVRRLVQARTRSRRQPVFLAVHSFTPSLHRVMRPWHVGVLWDRDRRIAFPLMRALRSGGDLVVGDNEPYSGRHPADFTVDHHAERAGLAHVGIELRQDLIGSVRSQAQWGDRLAEALRRVLDDERLYRRADAEDDG